MLNSYIQTKEQYMPNEIEELNDLLAKAVDYPLCHLSSRAYDKEEDSPYSNSLTNLMQWTTSDEKIFIPTSHTKIKLVPGVYEIKHSQNNGVFFQRIPIKTEGLLRFPQTNCEKVVNEIQTFWNKEDIFKEYKLTYKRGIMLWGPAGGGKTCLMQLVMKDVVERKGVVFKFNHPSLFLEGMRIFREIEPTTPAVVLMEDIDSIIEINGDSEVLNILDGVDQVEKVVFLASTNYPEKLGARIINRPSRFDKRFKIDHPNAESRRMYFEHIIGKEKIKSLKIDLDKWVKDTNKFSIAHLKELFVAVVILGDNYNESLKALKSMKETISSEDDFEKMHGFAGYKEDK